MAEVMTLTPRIKLKARATPLQLRREIDRLENLRGKIRPRWWATTAMLTAFLLIAVAAFIDSLLWRNYGATGNLALLVLVVGLTFSLHRHCNWALPLLLSMIVGSISAALEKPAYADGFLGAPRATVVDRIEDAIKKRRRALAELESQS